MSQVGAPWLAIPLACPEFPTCNDANSFCVRKAGFDGFKTFTCNAAAGLYECGTRAYPLTNCTGKSQSWRIHVDNRQSISAQPSTTAYLPDLPSPTLSFLPSLEMSACRPARLSPIWLEWWLPATTTSIQPTKRRLPELSPSVRRLCQLHQHKGTF